MKTYLLTLALLFAASPTLIAQSGKTRQLSEYIHRIRQFNQDNPQEKVYLHFDNTGYFQGDTLWFKAYTVAASRLQPTELSKVLHVELLTPKGEVVDDKLLPIVDGQSHGEFALPTSYPAGFYEVRAYTRPMLNFGEACIFSRVFPVYEEPEVQGDYTQRRFKSGTSLQPDTRQREEKADALNLTFYPEGGQAVVGLHTRVAFEARDRQGRPVAVTGNLCNRRGEVIAPLATIDQGRGVFEFTPRADEAYQARITYERQTHTFPLADIRPEGYTLYIDNLGADRLNVSLAKSASLPLDTVALAVSCRGMVYDVQACALGDEAFTHHVDKCRLPAGVLQVTAYDSRGQVLAERLVFNRCNTPARQATVTTDKETYAPFEKVRLTLALPDSTRRNRPATFSLAVRDASTQLYTAYEENILTDLLLSSDLKGYIHNPMQYFTADDRSTRARLDLLMMVQGWRRYDWPLMAGTKPFEPTHFVEPGLPVYGQVISLTSRKPLRDMDVTFWISRDGAALHGRSRTREDGRFYFAFPDSLHLTGSWQLGLMTSQKGKRKHSRIMLDRLYSPQGRSYNYFDRLVKDTVLTFAATPTERQSLSGVQLLPEVSIRRTKVRKGISGPDVVIDLDRIVTRWQDEGAVYPATVGEYLERYVPSFNYTRYEMKRFVTDDNQVYHDLSAVDDSYGLPVETAYRYGKYETVWGIRYHNEATWAKYNREPYTYNRIDLDDVQRIEIYSSNKLKYQEFARETAMHQPSPDFSDQAVKEYVLVLLYLYDDGWHNGYQKGMRQTRYQAYSPTHSFYHVDNSDRVPGETDFRRTLYWNPYVRTDAEGRATVELYNNSTCRRMVIEAAGVTADGGLLYTP